MAHNAGYVLFWPARKDVGDKLQLHTLICVQKLHVYRGVYAKGAGVSGFCYRGVCADHIVDSNTGCYENSMITSSLRCTGGTIMWYTLQLTVYCVCWTLVLCAVHHPLLLYCSKLVVLPAPHFFCGPTSIEHLHKVHGCT